MGVALAVRAFFVAAALDYSRRSTSVHAIKQAETRRRCEVATVGLLMHLAIAVSGFVLTHSLTRSLIASSWIRLLLCVAGVQRGY